MDLLRTGKSVIQLRFEPVQQFPGQGDVGLRVAGPVGYKPPRLLLGEHADIRGGVAPLQFETPPRRGLRRDHRLQPSSCRSPTSGPSAATLLRALAGSPT